MFSDEVKDCATRAVLCWLATTDEAGDPSVSPKEIWHLTEAGAVVIADIASAGSVRRIERHPAVCVSFIDVFRQKGFKLLGDARIVACEDPDFSSLSKGVIRLAGTHFVVRNLVLVSVRHVRPILAPGYAVRRRSEAEMEEDAYRTYGVQPIR